MSNSDFENEIPRIESALRFIPSDDRDIWFKVGAALHHASGGSVKGTILWTNWSAKSAKYNYKDQMRTWMNFRKDHENPIDLGTLFQLAKEYGWEPEYEALLGQFQNTEIPVAKPIRPTDLTKKIIDRLAERYAAWGNRPSVGQWMALNDLANHIVAMADGTLYPLYHLCSLDPGLGKSLVSKIAIQCLLESEEYEHEGIIVFVGRLREIQGYIQDMNLKADSYAVLVADTPENKELNSLGNLDKTKARVLFSTQQRLEAQAKRTQSFEAIQEFYFQGRPRRVRIWDETCCPGRTIMVNAAQVESMKEPASKYAPDDRLYRVLENLIAEVRAAKDGQFVDIPDFEEAAGVDLNLAIEIYEDEGKATRDAVNDLWLLNGLTVVVRSKDMKDKPGELNTFLNYENTLPEDIKPIIVCDASGRVRHTYTHWAKGRMDLVGLHHAPKDYSNLTIHVWKRGGSKSAWKGSKDVLIEGIVNTILTKPYEEWLIVHHKQSKKFPIDVPRLVKKALGKEFDTSRLKFIHWIGEDYRASNEYQDIRNVILAGTLFYEHAYYESMGRLSRGMKSDEVFDKKSYNQIVEGEHANLILQALCRGNVRKSLNGNCGHCDAYIITHPRHGIPELLPGIFPGANIADWSPVDKDLTGKVKLAFDHITNRFANDNTPLKHSEVYTKLGIEKANWNNDIINHPDFEAAINLAGIAIDRRKGRGGNNFIKLH